MNVFRTISGAILCALTLVVAVACGSHSAMTAAPASPPTSAAISTTRPAPSENASALAAESLAAESRAAASSSSAAKAARVAAAKAAASKAAAAKAAAAKAAVAKAAVAKAAAEKAAADKASAAAAAASAKASAAQAAQASAAQQAQASSQTAPVCTPGYSPCIPPGPDVDCAGGSGNGPRYVQGPVTVTGSDPYGLDSDHDGIGCEN
jgi:hypothetical protein